MNVRLLLSLMFFPLAAVCASSSPPLALRPGEAFTYRVGWGLFGGAGEIKISAQKETLAGSPQLRLTTTTATRGFIHLLYPFTAAAESIFDPYNGRLLSTHATSAAGHKHTEASMVFDYDRATASYVDRLHPERNKPALVIPSGNPADLITSLIQARAYTMKPGDTCPALALFDDEFYELTIVADHYEKIHTPLGDFETLVLIPRMDKDPKGMFKRGAEVRVWISQDSRHLPVQLEVKLKFGTAIAHLTAYTPPAATPHTVAALALVMPPHS
ncbi:MAG TPA: DUF3108 domain-containing protein [Opitutaceae bacterium]|jgi:hypothetical protein|nr:DUF3108 domain-containing protein [Opitutaceae bacterium]